MFRGGRQFKLGEVDEHRKEGAGRELVGWHADQPHDEFQVRFGTEDITQRESLVSGLEDDTSKENDSTVRIEIAASEGEAVKGDDAVRRLTDDALDDLPRDYEEHDR